MRMGVSQLVKAAVEGKLATRADASKHQGDFRKIVQGVNDTLDAVIGPLNVAAKYVDQISKGDIPAKITDNYKGDFNELKNNLNMCIDAVNGLVAEAGALSKAAVDGKLATRADASKHQGDFRKIVQGVNETWWRYWLQIGLQIVSPPLICFLNLTSDRTFPFLQISPLTHSVCFKFLGMVAILVADWCGIR